MAEKAKLGTPDGADTAANVFALMQQAGFGKAFGRGTAWYEAMGVMSAEVMHFVADRIKEDVRTQHAMLQCKSLAELQHVQAQFLERAMDQYQAETGKLVELGTSALAEPKHGKPS